MNFTFMDFMDSTIRILLLGIGIGVLLEVVAVFVTAYIFRHSRRSEPSERPPVPIQRPIEPVRQVVLKQESRMSQVGFTPMRTPEPRTGTVLVNRKPVMLGQAQPIVRSQPIVREQPVVIKEQPVREPIVVRERPVMPRNASVARAQAIIQEQLINPDTEPTPVEPLLRTLSRFIYSRFIYYVDDREETYQTLLGILQALFPEEATRYSQTKRPQWNNLPKNIRDSIHREEVSK